MAKQMSSPRGRSATSAAAAERPTAAAASTATTSEDAISLLRGDHREVEKLFERYEKSSSTSEKQQLAQEVCQQLNVHTLLEEELFYPACREKGVQHEALDEAQVEHDGAKVMIGELMEGSPEDEFYDAKLGVLAEYIKHHVNEEEKPQDGIFAKAREAGLDVADLGQRLKARRQQLLVAAAISQELPKLRSLKLIRFRQNEQESQMNRYSERHRDERGRFEEEDRPRYRGEPREDFERRGDSGYERPGEGRGWYGDPEGHSRASEEGWAQRGERGESRGGYRGRNEQDEDERYPGGSGRRGWYGDSQGHARASEEGWERREGTRPRGQGEYRGRREEEDERYSGRGRGWYGDPEGHSRASEEGWEQRGEPGRGEGGYRSRREEDDERESGGRGRSGWYGDSEGHSRASEEGWRHREQGAGGSRGYSARSSRDENDEGRHSSSGRGWYGDAEGHSRASEEGWRHRGSNGSRGSSRH